LDQTKISGSSPFPSGKSTLKMGFAYDGGQGGGGTVTLSIDGNEVGSGTIAKTQPNVYSADETAGVFVDHTLQSSKFTGSIDRVTINTNPSD